jgi:hypothetical protein
MFATLLGYAEKVMACKMARSYEVDDDAPVESKG